MAQSFAFMQDVLKICKDDYSLFTFSSGVYTAEEIDKTDIIGTKLQNVEVIFKQGQLVSVTFVANDNVEYEFNNFDSTDITLPQDYTESNE